MAEDATLRSKNVQEEGVNLKDAIPLVRSKGMVLVLNTAKGCTSICDYRVIASLRYFNELSHLTFTFPREILTDDNDRQRSFCSGIHPFPNDPRSLSRLSTRSARKRAAREKD